MAQKLTKEDYFRIMSAYEDQWSTVGENKNPTVNEAKSTAMTVSRPSRVSLGRIKPKMRPLPKKSKPGRKKGWRGVTAGDVVDYGWKGYQMAKQLWTLMNVEEKIWDVDGSGGTTITSTPSIINLTNIAQGSDYFNRIGDSILAQRIELRLYALSNSASSYHWMRVLLVSDKEQRGTDPVLGDVLQGGTAPQVQPLNALTAQRFTVHYDKLMHINNLPGLATSGTNTTYVPQIVEMPDLIKKWNKHILYSGTTGADASNLEGAMYLMAVSSDPTNGPSLKYTFRLAFTDN